MAEAIEIVVDSSYEKLKGKCISDLRLDENINIPAGMLMFSSNLKSEIHFPFSFS